MKKEKVKKTKVFVALSGGVDSSVAAALLVKAGYDVTAAYMVNYDDRNQESGIRNQGKANCWLPDYRDAVRVAAKLHISIIKLDFTKEYKRDVLEYMFKEYAAGRTPNPDVVCNKFVKFGAWLRYAKSQGFDFLATGHYARIERDLSLPSPLPRRGGDDSFSPPQRREREERSGLASIHLLAAKDTNKDQSYFLHQLTQEQLKHVLFPIGEYTKPEVRALAKKFGLPTAEKEESTGICFIGEVPMKEFLETKIKHKPGKIVLSPTARGGARGGGSGTVVGKHDGLAFYTIGQRHIGLNQPPPNPRLTKAGEIDLPLRRGGAEGLNRPLYVLAKRPKTNELIVGFEDDPLMYTKETHVSEVNWISGQPPKFPLQCEVRLRHRQPLQKCRIMNQESGIRVRFKTPQRAVTPGQFAVLYKKVECLGGGVIS